MANRSNLPTVGDVHQNRVDTGIDRHDPPRRRLGTHGEEQR
jgi:hypothetical protein